MNLGGGGDVVIVFVSRTWLLSHSGCRSRPGTRANRPSYPSMVDIPATSNQYAIYMKKRDVPLDVPLYTLVMWETTPPIGSWSGRLTACPAFPSGSNFHPQGPDERFSLPEFNCNTHTYTPQKRAFNGSHSFSFLSLFYFHSDERRSDSPAR